MRALFLNENLGGHATLHLHLQRALADDDRVEATFLHVPPPGLARRALSASVPGLGRSDLDLQSLRSQLALSAVARRLVEPRLAATDVLHAYSQNAALLLEPVMHRVPTVVTVDTTNQLHAFRLPHRQPTRWTARMLPLTLRFERRVFAAAQLVVAQSEYAARSLREDYGLAAPKLRVVRFGITDHGGDVASPGEGRPVITFVGNSMQRKGGHLLLDVFSRELADRADLTLITRESVPARAGVRVVNDIRPGDERLWEQLRRSAVMVLPSEIDYSPNAVLEAMAAGLPVVTTRIGALEEVVEHGVTGYLVDPGDAGALVHWLNLLIDDPALRARMGAASRAAFEARWDARTEAKNLVTVLEEAIELGMQSRS